MSRLNTNFNELLQIPDNIINAPNPDLNYSNNIFFNPQNICASSTVFNEPLDSKICDLLISEIKSEQHTFSPALVSSDEKKPSNFVLKNVRNSQVFFLPKSHWAYGIVWNYVSQANVENWQYDISMIQTIQITKYDVGGFYNWHVDFNADKTHPDHFRKLSITIQLNEPSEYEGGVLQVFDYHNKRIDIEKKRGSACVFESRTLHRVTKVKSGTRYSLVAWIIGPKLR